jgi:hypothetical protein
MSVTDELRDEHFPSSEYGPHVRARAEMLAITAFNAGKRRTMNYDLELISAKVHEQWMESKRTKGVTSRKSESGEELMVPYEQLSESAKDLDRGSVKAVLDAIAAVGA